MKTCPNCGCRVYDGLCVNCDEESYIMQQDEANVRDYGCEPTEFSNDFMSKYLEQQKKSTRL